MNAEAMRDAENLSRIRYGLMRLLINSPCVSSGVSMWIQSARFAASSGATTTMPSARACCALGRLGSRPTMTLWPLSRRFCAWACPWLP